MSIKNIRYKYIVLSEEYRVSRPLWSYYLQNLGFKTFYINYSTNHSNQIKFYPKYFKSGK